MVPKVEGARGHPLRRPAAGPAGGARRAGRPILVHAILETASGVANVEEIAGASPRMQGISLGPADLAASRRMKTTRVGGGHPGYLVRTDPTGDDLTAGRQTYQQDLWHYTVARMVDACARTGSCRTTARSATSATPSPARTSSATPSCSAASARGACTRCRSTIAKKVFSPEPSEVAWARRVIAAMGDGTGAVMIDGKMQDDATYKQCRVVAELADALAARDPELAQAYDAATKEALRMTDAELRPAAPCSTCPAPTSVRWRRPRPCPPTR